ncbi:FAD-binding oxidoreductase [Massilia terrae]|uniref:FAD-binding oxidoreductase n=1 Tax=Massilia terrae TaxID=1811224 RepID=A0ABT2CV31_9BURK|nr:FAD-binding oxidoreductase [Massilia terrae]MCS0657456.1 FAD-binding oxidoreductase [Massilia terrae]
MRAAASTIDELPSLLAQIAHVAGHANLLTDAATLARYAMSTASRPVAPLAVVRPGTTGEVAALARLASRHRVPIYPVSTGRNWGYGDACAPASGQVLLDLSRMNRIIEVDRELAYAVIEPGVTQQQLSDFLRDQGTGLWCDCTGAGPDTSFVGNILERGFGHSPYGNRLQHVAGMQVVLASGEVLETGFGHFPNARARHVFPYGVGPFLDGLFTQSNFGIVTRIGLWLMPQAACVNHFLCSVSRHGDVAALVDALRPLRLDGTLRSIVHIGNDLRVLSGGRHFPRDLVADGSCLPDDLRRSMCDEGGIRPWTASGALYGTARQVAAARAALRRALARIGVRPTFITAGKLKVAAHIARLLGPASTARRLRARVALGEALLAINRGEPNGRFLAGAYWRRRSGMPDGFPTNADPARDNCGLMWISPVLPMRGADLLAVHGLAEPVFRRHRFDLFATFSMITERALGGVLTVAYDKEDPDELARAQACYREVFARMMEAGYIPYRVGNHSMRELDPGDDVFWKTVATIKTALDPAGVIAPGRYEPARVRSA